MTERARDDTRTLAARLWRLSFAPRLPNVIVAVSLMVLVALVSGAQVTTLDWIGRLIESGAAERLWWGAALAVALGAAKGGALFAQVVMTQRLALKVIEDLQRIMHAAVLRADFARISAEPPGALAARFVSDVERVRESVVRTTTNLGRDVAIVLVMIGVMLWLDWMLALLILCIYPLLFKPVIDIGQRVRATSTRAQEQMGDLSAFLSEGFAGTRLVKTYGLEGRQTDRANTAFEHRYHLAERIARARASVEPLLEFIGGVAFAGVAAFTAWRLTQGDYPISRILAFVAALAMMAPAARAIGTLTAVAQEGLAALARVFAIVDEEPTIQEAPGAPALITREGRVTFESVSFTYPDGSSALQDVDLTLEPGTVTALVGPSGAGKSTVLNLLPRLYDVSSGAVRIDGQDIRDVTIESVRRKIGFVSQDVALFDDTIGANVAFGRPGANATEIWEALEAAAARPFVDALPNKLDEPVGPGGSKLSGGERQRIALARAVLKDAPILLLDEATSALDAESEAHVQEALTRLAEGRTTLAIAHRLSTVRAADRIYVMEGGRIVERGNDESLVRAGGLYARLRQLQFAETSAR